VLRRRRAAGMLRERWDILLVIAAGGALGSLARWAVTEAVPHSPWGVPWGTWLENVGGAFVLGLLMVFILDFWPPSRYVRPFFGVGVLGGYTTFSTYMLDARDLLAEGHLPAAFGYLFGTVVAGLVAVAAGVILARLAVRAAERRHQRRREQRARDTGDVPAHSDVHEDPDQSPAARSTP